MLRCLKFLLPLWGAACLGGALPAADAPPATGRHFPADEITAIARLRSLSREEAEKQHPLRIRGTVTAILPMGYSVQDETGPTFVFTGKRNSDGLDLGQVVEVAGITDPGRHSPQIQELRRTRLGTAPMPEPRRLTYERLISGREDNYFAEIEGVVRRIQARSGEPFTHQMALAMGEGRVEVSLYSRTPLDVNQLVDARVRLRGMVSGGLNQKGQWVRARFTVCQRSDIIVEEEAPADPFALPLRSVAALLRWSLHHAEGHRVRVRGVVTLRGSGESMFIREDQNGLQVQLRDNQLAAEAGDVVEVIGFPALGAYSAILEDAVFRPVGRAPVVAPTVTNAEALLNGTSDANLVRVRGTLLESVRRQMERTLVVQADNIVFTASVEQTRENERLDALSPGAILELTGVSLAGDVTSVGRVLQPRNFTLLLRNPSDIVVLREPSWWTAERLTRALAIVALFGLVVLVWVWLLRRQVRSQAAVLSEKAQREAVLAERSRLAREFHDTLEQDLTGVSLQLEVATMLAEGSPVMRQLQIAHRLLQRSQIEVRQSVWDLRRAGFVRYELSDALREGVTQSVQGAATQLHFDVQGEPRKLPGVKEHHVLRIGREAATNAVKHAQASSLYVKLHYGEDELMLTVEDDGCGFVQGQAPGSESGHFGLIGMQERAGKLGGRLTLQSRPGHGTRIELTVPLVASEQPHPPIKSQRETSSDVDRPAPAFPEIAAADANTAGPAVT